MNKRILAAAAIVAALVAVGATLAIQASSSNEQPPAALARARVPSDALPATALSAAAQRGLATEQSRRIAADTYIVPSQSSSDLCLVTILGNEMRATCNPQQNFFGGRELVFTIAEEGSPTALTGLTIAGVARPSIAQIQAIFPGGMVESATPSADGGFVLTASAAALATGEPTSIAALDQAGHALETEPGPAN